MSILLLPFNLHKDEHMKEEMDRKMTVQFCGVTSKHGFIELGPMFAVNA